MGEIRSFYGKLARGSSASPSLVVGTFITHCAVMKEKGGHLQNEILLNGFDSETSIICQFYE